jgi:hypothetical protein
MSGFTFTPSETADPELLAKYEARFAKLAPACIRCGHRLAKGELDARVCRDRELCRIRRSGCSVSGFATLRKYRREHPEPQRPAAIPAHVERERTAVLAAVQAVAAVEVAAASVLPEPIAEPVEDLDWDDAERDWDHWEAPDPEPSEPITLVTHYVGGGSPSWAPERPAEPVDWRWYGRGRRRVAPA